MLPPEFNSLGSNKVCRLQKSLYGLKQASGQWFAKLPQALLALSYSQSQVDYSLFVKKDGVFIIVLLVYIDDLILTGNHLNEITAVKSYLHDKFKN